MKTLKYLNFLKNYAYSFFKVTVLFVRVIPTDRCNLDCLYCYQKSDDSLSMSLELFGQVLEKARELNVGFLSFLGGEPMLWKHLYDAIALCSRHHILTDITTNGTLLNDKTIERLGAAGLDCLNVSVDTRDDFVVSKKNVLFDAGLMRSLKAAERGTA